ncbi:glycosyltransferase family 4 protein [Sphingomonas sp.]|uniref:glycosyltransferase family 4 protein n=1 Tax=Sphingomonas sp. TaxID=28214 RepID=UPI001B1D9ABD|nr:glycosyltransferase family 4 protein [Sphingomonas sp.]MBO9711492.1 glycosyltransferase family 4 protein [Sphingomonas sp.]
MSAGSRGPTRIAVLNTHPIQYFAPLYAYLNRAEDLDVTALYLSDFSLRGARDPGFGQTVTWDIDLLEGYTSRFVGSRWRTAEPSGFSSMVAPELWREISRDRYDAVWVHGHGYAACLVAVAVARAKGIPVFMRGETHLGLPIAGAKAGLRRPLMQTLYAQCAGLLAIGSANADYYRAMGVPDRKISIVPYSVDNERFAAASRITAEERSEMRARLGVHDEAPVILYASKFQRRKHPDDLLAAFLKLRAQGIDAHLVMVGSGEMEAELHATAAKAGDANIHFPGFFNQSDLPRVFAACELFVLPSSIEPWGLIVNEVMCAGLPVVVAREVGCVPDLVHDGVNGALFPAGDVDALAAALATIAADAGLRARMGAASRERIAHWGFAECLAGVREALRKAGVTGAAA